jgi:hypothetical protein
MKPVNFTPFSCSSFTRRRLVDPGEPRGRDALGLLVLLRLELRHDLGVADEDLADLAALHLLQQLAHRHRLRRRTLRDHALDEEERGEGEEEIGTGELCLLLSVVVHGQPRFGVGATAAPGARAYRGGGTVESAALDPRVRGSIPEPAPGAPGRTRC